MILFDLKCEQDHVFEAWFKDSKTFEAQAAAGEVPCPVCGNTKVEKALMAPRVATRKGGSLRSDDGAMAERMERVTHALYEMRRHVEDNCDYVGEKFPEEARRIHYGEAASRSIYGEATPEEAEELIDEGVEFQRIPWAPREDA